MWSRSSVLSRHRLPAPYRLGLTGLWLTPAALFGLVFVLRGGLDMRLLPALLLMLLPAWYVWQEGLDIHTDGIVRRVHVPCYFRYADLETWYCDTQRRTLTIWDAQQRKQVECRLSHLTDLPLLLRSLQTHLRYRHWPV